MDRTMKSNEVRTGFRYQDEVYLRKYDNAVADPDIQIFYKEDDQEEPELKQYWCAICQGKLTYMKPTDTIWKCDNCQETYDTKIQDRPITNKRAFKITPHHEINRYPKLDDIDIPFLNSINLNEQQDSDIEILRQSEDGRIKHIRLVNNCTKEEAYSKTRNL
jgi:ribosomal protein L37AE/L43A